MTDHKAVNTMQVCLQLAHTPFTSTCSPGPWEGSAPTPGHRPAGLVLPATPVCPPHSQWPPRPAAPSASVLCGSSCLVSLTGGVTLPFCQAQQRPVICSRQAGRGGHLCSYTYESPLGAATKYHKIRTTHICHLTEVGNPKGASLSYFSYFSQGVRRLWAFRGSKRRCISLPFPASGGCPHPLAHDALPSSEPD